jgi:membrane protein YqaA with SNARE-associated domain
MGAPVLLLSWLPIIGDALCVMAGWLKLPWRVVLVYMTLGKFVRFVVMTLALLWIPDDIWTQIGQWFK